MKKVIQKIRRFLFAVTHCVQIQENNRILEKHTAKLADTLRETEQKAEAAEQRAKDMESESYDFGLRQIDCTWSWNLRTAIFMPTKRR